ncbi:MAG: hypothetical protein Q8O19_04835 [Rectinemataceae bacterium]|nr:hypothetical protein [Rectinemataceae bacterium]
MSQFRFIIAASQPLQGEKLADLVAEEANRLLTMSMIPEDKSESSEIESYMRLESAVSHLTFLDDRFVAEDNETGFNLILALEALSRKVSSESCVQEEGSLTVIEALQEGSKLLRRIADYIEEERDDMKASAEEYARPGIVDLVENQQNILTARIDLRKW